MLLVPVAIGMATREDGMMALRGGCSMSNKARGTGAEWNPAGLRWLRAAAESGQSGWPEVPPPVGTRKKLTLTSGRFRAQIDGFDADPRYPGD